MLIAAAVCPHPPLLVPEVTGADGPGAAELRWDVAIERASGNYLTYWITVTNLTSADVTFEGRYCVLGRI